MASSMLKTIFNPDKKEWMGTTNSFTLDPTVSYVQMLLKELEKYPNVVIQINHDTGNQMTCKEMLLKVKKIAENLKQLNIQIGDFVTIAAEHHENLVPIFLGILAVGAVVNPLHSGFSVLEFNHFLDMVKPKLIICDGCITDTITKSLKSTNHSALMYTFLQSNDPSIKLVDELFNEFDTNPANYVPPNLGDLGKALAFILCSSGTTGPPKGVLISHGMALCGLVLRGVFPEGVTTFNTSSLYWLTSITHIASSIVCRSPRVITAKPITQNLLLEILEKHRIFGLFTAPIFVADIANGLEEQPDKWNLLNLRLVLSAGSALSENIIISMVKLLPTASVVSAYGITDAGGGVACRTSIEKMKSVGSLVPGTLAKIITNDLNQKSLEHNEIGEVCLKKPFPLLGYLKNEEATKNSYDSDGWLHTGDLGYFDDDNDLFLVDREKDIFKYRGFQISPSELEVFLEKTFTGIVKDVVIVGIPDEKLVAIPAAAIVLHENQNVTVNDICKAIEDNFSDTKKLRGGVFFVKDLPRTRTGKFLRNLIRDTFCKLYNQKNNIIE